MRHRMSCVVSGLSALTPVSALSGAQQLRALLHSPLRPAPFRASGPYKAVATVRGECECVDLLRLFTPINLLEIV